MLSENDGMAGGVVAALEAQGLAGQVPVSGQDGDQAALNRVALGTQTVDVWKDSRDLGTAAGEAALQLCANPDVTAVEGTAPFTTPEGNEVTSILLEPIPITQDNLDVVLDAGWIDQETLCQGVEPGTVAACDAEPARRRRHRQRHDAAAAGTEAAGHRGDGHGAGDDQRLTFPTLTVRAPCAAPAQGADDAMTMTAEVRTEAARPAETRASVARAVDVDRDRHPHVRDGGRAGRSSGWASTSGPAATS